MTCLTYTPDKVMGDGKCQSDSDCTEYKEFFEDPRCGTYDVENNGVKATIKECIPSKYCGVNVEISDANVDITCAKFPLGLVLAISGGVIALVGIWVFFYLRNKKNRATF